MATKRAAQKGRGLRPRGRGEGSIYWVESRKRFRAAVVASQPGERTTRRTVSGRTAREVEEKLERLQYDITQGRRAARNLTLDRWIEQWLAIAGHKPSTRRDHRSKAKYVSASGIGRVQVDALNAQHVRTLHSYMKTRNVSATTVKHAHSMVSSALNEAIRHEHAATNPFARIRPPTSKRQDPKAMSADELARFRKTVSALPGGAGARWLIAVEGGGRQGEVLGMTWEHTHLDAEVPYVDVRWSLGLVAYACGCGNACRRAGQTCPAARLDIDPESDHINLFGGFTLQVPKTAGSRRLIPLLPGTVAALRIRREVYEVERTAPDFTDFDLVWARQNGLPLTGITDSARWHELREQAGVSELTLREGRNSAATAMLRAGVPARVVQELMGHSRVATTHGYQNADLSLIYRGMREAAET